MHTDTHRLESLDHADKEVIRHLAGAPRVSLCQNCVHLPGRQLLAKLRQDSLHLILNTEIQARVSQLPSQRL